MGLLERFRLLVEDLLCDATAYGPFRETARPIRLPMPAHTLPDDPLDFIQRCVRERRIGWTYHITMRLKGRFIARQEIVESVADYEIIEEYPKDKYLPSYLVYSQYKGRIFHVLFATDVEGDNVRVVTAYSPSLDEWEIDLKTRRRSS